MPAAGHPDYIACVPHTLIKGAMVLRGDCDGRHGRRGPTTAVSVESALCTMDSWLWSGKLSFTPPLADHRSSASSGSGDGGPGLDSPPLHPEALARLLSRGHRSHRARAKSDSRSDFNALMQRACPCLGAACSTTLSQASNQWKSDSQCIAFTKHGDPDEFPNKVDYDRPCGLLCAQTDEQWALSMQAKLSAALNYIVKDCTPWAPSATSLGLGQAGPVSQV